MMEAVEERIDRTRRGERVGFYLAAYATWIVASGLGAVVAAYWHSLGSNLYIALRLDKWTFQLFASSLALGLVIAWLILVIVLEHWLSNAGTLARLGRRAAWLLVPELIVVAASYLAMTYLVTRYV